MAVVSRKPKTETQEAGAEPAKVEAKAQVVPKTIKLELRFLGRYFFQNTLYEKGKVYEFEENDAREMLSHTVDSLPVFTFAKPRVKYVEVPVDDGVVRVKAKQPRVEKRDLTLEQFAAEQQGKDTQIAPIQTIDLSDDDPEITAKLAAVDADGDDKGTEV